MNIMSLKRKSRAGFTLVELIVVIAILAILAGVAIPVYSGYIKKANEASDLQLLSAVNTAFGAACAEYGLHPSDVSTALLSGDTTITGIKTIVLKASASPLSSNSAAEPTMLSANAHARQLSMYSEANFKNSFDRYFQGNTTVQLKFYESASDFVFENGSFVGKDNVKGAALSSIVHDEDAGTTTYTFALANGEEATYTVNDDDIQAIQDSTFGQNMSVDELLGDVTGMVGALNDALGGGTLMSSLLEGFTLPDGSSRTLEEWGVTADPTTEHDEYLSQLANAAVMLVASSTTADTTTNLLATLSGTGTMTLNDMMNPNYTPEGSDHEQGYGAVLSNMAGLYGVATAFANSDAGSEWSITVGETTMDATQYYDYVNQRIVAAANTQNFNNIMNALGLLTAYIYVNPNDMNNSAITESFISYSTTTGDNGKTQLENDAAGYVSAMQTIANNDGALITSGGVTDGYDSASIAAILSLILGN